MSSTLSSRYGATAIALHWLLAVASSAPLASGLRMTGLPSRRHGSATTGTSGAGVTILALSAARLLWRLANRPPALPASIDKVTLAGSAPPSTARTT